MTTQTKEAKGKPRGFVLVRDKDGNPKFDSYNSIPQEIFNQLSPKDQEFINRKRAEKPWL